FASSTRYNRQPKGRRIRFCERVLRQLNVEFNSNNNNNSSSANDDEIVAQRAKRRKTSTPNLSGGGAVNDDSNRSSSSSLIDELLYKAEENLSRDQAKIERQMRAARYAAEMDTDVFSGEYMHFSEARQLTFLPSACQKISKQASRRFLKWILGVWDENNLDEEATFDQDFLENQLRLQSWVDLLSADDIIVDMLNFLARETLSLLVDCAFFVKRECRPPNTPINYSSADIYRVRPIAPPPPAPRCSDDDCGGNLGVKNAAEFRQPTISLETNRSQTFGGYTTSNSASSSTNGRKRPLDEEKSYCPPQVPISSSEVTANLVDALTQRALTTCNSRMTVNNSQTSTNNQIQPSTINLTTDKTALQCWEVREAFRRLEYYEKFRKV
uniref:DUF4378 domain-containing protein n=1 Tax=Romanomermis culicivorax TaxID=13658 RepID=A0A915HH07_ROMCU